MADPALGLVAAIVEVLRAASAAAAAAATSPAPAGGPGGPGGQLEEARDNCCGCLLNMGSAPVRATPPAGYLATI